MLAVCLQSSAAVGRLCLWSAKKHDSCVIAVTDCWQNYSDSVKLQYDKWVIVAVYACGLLCVFRASAERVMARFLWCVDLCWLWRCQVESDVLVRFCVCRTLRMAQCGTETVNKRLHCELLVTLWTIVDTACLQPRTHAPTCVFAYNSRPRNFCARHILSARCNFARGILQFCRPLWHDNCCANSGDTTWHSVSRETFSCASSASVHTYTQCMTTMMLTQYRRMVTM